MTFNPLDFDGMLDRIIDGEEDFPDSLVVATLGDEDFDDVVDGIVKQRTAFGKLNLLLDRMTWNQKIAVALIALDKATKNQIVQVLISKKDFNEQVQEALDLVSELQPETQIEMAIEILESPRDENV